MWRLISALVLVLPLTGCGYNTFQSQDEQITAKYSRVARSSPRS